jgi:hypothetical protein
MDGEIRAVTVAARDVTTTITLISGTMAMRMTTHEATTTVGTMPKIMTDTVMTDDG